LLALLAHGKIKPSAQANRWLSEHLGVYMAKNETKHLEGYEETIKVFVQSLSVQERLKGLAAKAIAKALAPNDVATVALQNWSQEQRDALMQQLKTSKATKKPVKNKSKAT
jgi:GTP cyclohydrolase I